MTLFVSPSLITTDVIVGLTASVLLISNVASLVRELSALSRTVNVKVTSLCEKE